MLDTVSDGFTLSFLLANKSRLVGQICDTPDYYRDNTPEGLVLERVVRITQEYGGLNNKRIYRIVIDRDIKDYADIRNVYLHRQLICFEGWTPIYNGIA